MRVPSPVVCTEAATISPPNTSHAAVDWKPAKTTSGGAPATVTARKQKITAVRYSGMTAVAHRPMHATATAAAGRIPSGIPVRCVGATASATPAAQAAAATSRWGVERHSASGCRSGAWSAKAGSRMQFS